MACKRLLFALISLGFFSGAQAAIIEQPLADVAQEQMARGIFNELKCVVCEGQSLSESDATLARQMREHVRVMVADGQSRDAILTYFSTTYGDQILLTPPLKQRTVLLWLTPLLLLAVGGLLMARATRNAPKET